MPDGTCPPKDYSGPEDVLVPNWQCYEDFRDGICKVKHDFVFLTDYPLSIRPFYHMVDEATGLTKSYDLIYNGVEITTGAQREHRIDVLEAQAVQKGLDLEGLESYLDFFRYGIPPHGGFGMGLARVLMLLLGEQSIRETTYLFRGPTRLTP